MNIENERKKTKVKMGATVQGRYHTNGKKNIAGKFGADAVGRKKDGDVWSLWDPHELNMSNGEEL